MIPLQVPGGVEILIILLVLLFNFVIIAVVVMAFVYLYRRWDKGGADESDVDALRERVADLESQVAELDAAGDDGAGESTARDDR